MAVTGIAYRSRLLFRFEIQKVFNYSTLVNTCLINKLQCPHSEQFRQCRKFTGSVPLSEKLKEKDKKLNHESKSDTSSTSSSSDSDQEEDDVTVEYVHGLPQVTLPLPSRREKCRFTLRPISNTVGDLLEMVKKEDKGIDRAVIHSLDGTRIASSNSIEFLLQENFTLYINDNSYFVRIPEHQKITNEEVKQLDDIKTLISRLYETLHVEDFHVLQEKDLQAQLELLQQEMQPLEMQRQNLEMIAERKSNFLAWAGLGLMSIQFGILARLTWWEYSWDIMEPVTYFVTYGTAMAAYSYFVLTKEEYVLQDVKNRQHLLTLHKKSKKVGLDVNRYNQLVDQINSLELELLKAKAPLKKFKDVLPPKVPPTELVNKLEKIAE